MTFTLQELTTMFDGELVGDPALKITGAASLGEAVSGEIAFFSDPRYGALLRKTHASAVLVPLNFSDSISAAQIRVVNPAKAFEQVVVRFAPNPITFAPSVHPSSIVSSCRIYPHATIRERSRIGSRVIIHGGVVIGADGFGFEFVGNRHKKIPQLGIVQIDDDVEIGANTTIDRARFGRTWIQEGVKIDNLVQIAHNVIIGKHSIIAAQTGISGSTCVGEKVMMAGQVGIIGHLTIEDNTIIAAQSGISKDLPGGAWFGSPAVPLPEAKRQIAWIHRLGKLFDRVKAIEKKLGL